MIARLLATAHRAPFDAPREVFVARLAVLGLIVLGWSVIATWVYLIAFAVGRA